MRCWQPLGLPVLPLVYMRNSGASASMGTGSTICAGIVREDFVHEEIASFHKR